MSKRLPEGARRRLRPLRASARDAIRLGLLASLALAADYLSTEHALALAAFAGRVDATPALDAGGLRREMREAFALDPLSATVQARTRAARRYIDYVVNRRIRSGREEPSSWIVRESNPGVVDELRHSGASFVIATAHFARQPSYALWTGRTIPHRIVGVTLPAADAARSKSLHGRWGSRHLALMLDVWGRAEEVEFAYVDNQMIAASLVARLRRPGTAVVISTDAPVSPDSQGVHRRAFAGHALQEFALGTAAIARAAGCPVVVCHPYLEPDGTVVLEWAGPFVADGEAPDSDVRVTDMILDELERMIGRDPTQYVLEIGIDRQWNAAQERWEPV